MRKSSAGTKKGKRKEPPDFTLWENMLAVILGPFIMLFFARDLLWEGHQGLKGALAWLWRRLMIIALVGLFGWMAWFAHAGMGGSKEFLYAALAAFFVACRYSPWYILLGMWPYWLSACAVETTLYGGWTAGGGLIGHYDLTGSALTWWAAWCYVVWMLYPFVRGVFHQIDWERERVHGWPKHKVVNHPYALMGTAAAITALTSLPAKEKRQGPE